MDTVLVFYEREMLKSVENPKALADSFIHATEILGT